MTDDFGAGGAIAVGGVTAAAIVVLECACMRKSTQICITRHGETDWNAAGILQGWLDVPVNALGRRQTVELSETFAASGFSCVYTSPLNRAFECASIMAGRLKLPAPIIHHGLKERHFGVIQGIPKAELAELNPVLFGQILKRNPGASFEQGESMDDFATRVLDAIMNIAEQRPGERVLVMTHGWVMDVVIRHLHNLPRSAILHVKPKNGECVWLNATSESIRNLQLEIR